VDIFLTSLVFALVCGLLATVSTLFSSSDGKHPLVAGGGAAVTMFILSLLSIYWFNPGFTFFPQDGYFWGILVTAIVAVVWAFASTLISDVDGGVNTLLLPLLVILVLLVTNLYQQVTLPPGVASDEGNASYYNYLHLSDAKEGEVSPDLNINQALRVSPGHALVKAKNAIPGNISSYLNLGDPYLQGIRVNGVLHPYYVVALKVSDTFAYNNAGNVIPGYILVDASDVDKDAEWHKLDDAHTMKYAQGPGIFSDWDLDRNVYFRYTLPQNSRIDELDGLEVDDDLNPWYTAAVMKPVTGGSSLYYPVGMIFINPHTGDIQYKDMKDIPDWVDRRLPEDVAGQLVSKWAEFSKHHVQFLGDNSLNKREIDEKTDVWTPEGLLFQFVLRPKGGNSNVTTDLIYVNPRDLTATRYSLDAATQSQVRDTFRAKSKNRFNQELDIAMLQIEWVAGQPVWYCVMEQSQKYLAVGLVQMKYTKAADNSKYLINTSLSSAIQDLRRQMASTTGSSGTDNFPNSSEFVQVEGVVDRVGAQSLSMDSNSWFGNFTLRTTVDNKQVLLICRYQADDITAVYLHEGDNVIVTLLSVNTDGINDVIQGGIVNHTYPLSVSTTPVAAPTAVPTLSP
jgi:hypothetical protein